MRRSDKLPDQPTEYDLEAQDWNIMVLPQKQTINRRLSGSEMMNQMARGKLHSVYKKEEEPVWRIIAYRAPGSWRSGRNIGDAKQLRNGMVAVGSYIADDLPSLARMILGLKKE